MNFIKQKEEILGDNKYLNNLKDIKSNNNPNSRKTSEDNLFGGNLLRTSFDTFDESKERKNTSTGKSKFAKNLFADFNNDALMKDDTPETGLFQIPEKNAEYDFVSELKGTFKSDPSNNNDFELENTDPISKFLDFESENSEFEMDEPNDLVSAFNHDDNSGAMKEEEPFQTPIKGFEIKPLSARHNLFSTVTAKKESKSNLFTDFMNSTNTTEPSTGDIFSIRKGELTSSSRKEPKGKLRPSVHSRFEQDYEILEVKKRFEIQNFKLFIDTWKWRVRNSA